MTAFFDRYDAGRQLGIALLAQRPADPVIIGVSRGGVPVASEVARILEAPLDLCVVRRIMVDDLTVGAVSECAIYLDDKLIARHAISPAALEAAVTREVAEVVRAAELLRDGSPMVLAGRDAIVVDDGVTTGVTLLAAARGLRSLRPRSLHLAIPVAATVALEALRPDFDRVTCLVTDPTTNAIGAYYQQFPPVSEAEVVATLATIARETREDSLRPAEVQALHL